KSFPARYGKFNALALLHDLYNQLGQPAQANKALAEMVECADRLAKDHPHMPWLGSIAVFQRSVLLCNRVRNGELEGWEAEAKGVLSSFASAEPGVRTDVKYNIACAYALAAGKVTDPGEQDRLGGRAVQLLEELRENGYFRNPGTWDHVGKDPDL